MLLYHGSSETVEFPEIRKARLIRIFILAFTAPSTGSRL